MFKKKPLDKTNRSILYFRDLKHKFEKWKTISQICNKVHYNHNKGSLTS